MMDLISSTWWATAVASAGAKAESKENLNTRPSSNNDWISVKDRLPEKVDEYLTVHCGIVSITNFRPDLDKNSPWFRGLGYKITHWMPLPQSPKETE